MRTVKIFSTNGIAGTIQTDAQTLGELIPYLDERGIRHAEMTKMIGETRNEISLEDAKLPEGDFKLYLVPTKTKSGASKEDLTSDISEEFENLANTCSNLSTLFARLSEKFNKGDKENGKVYSEEEAEAINEIKALTNRAGLL